MNAKECMIEADKLLQKWSCYSIENRRYIEKIFNGSNRYDMMLNVDVMQKQAKIYVLERGVTIYEYRTERKEIVIYAVLRDIIGIISDTFIRDSYVDEKGYLHFTENVSNYRNLLGGLYRENPVKSRNYEAVKSSKKWENVCNSYIIPALLLYRYSYI